MRTAVSIIGIFGKVLGPIFGEVPAYTTVRNWVLKLGLSVYEEDMPQKMKEFAVIIDESIMINKEKLLLTLGFNPKQKKEPLRHKDLVVLGMKVGASFNRTDVKDELDRISACLGSTPIYGISDGTHNPVGGFKDIGIIHHLDISHTLGNCMKHVYSKDPKFIGLTEKLGKIHLQYHLTEKAWLLPPNMRSIARFMNLQGWIEWASKMLICYNSLDNKMKEAYTFLLPYKKLVEELSICIEAIRYTEEICKNRAFGEKTYGLCKDYIIRHVVGNANGRRTRLGMKMIEYFNRQYELIKDNKEIHQISSDIIESEFGFYKGKQSPNKLNEITTLALMLPLYPKLSDYSVTDQQDFKVRLADVKLKDIDFWAKKIYFQIGCQSVLKHSKMELILKHRTEYPRQ